MRSELRAGTIAGAVAPFIFLLATIGISWLEEDFMDRFGWEVWPSGLALGPDGWLQIANFIVLGLLLMAFALAVRAVPARNRWMRAAPVLLALAGFAAVMLAFKTDPPDEGTSWHGTIHVAAYFTWLLSLLLSYPLTWWRVHDHAVWRRTRWPAALALLLFPPVLLLPDTDSSGNYVFFAVALTPLAVIAIRMAAGALRDEGPEGSLRDQRRRAAIT
jgi:Protein of unknown function (DUF998)